MLTTQKVLADSAKINSNSSSKSMDMRKTNRTMLLRSFLDYCGEAGIDSVDNKTLSDFMIRIKPLLPHGFVSGCMHNFFQKDYTDISFARDMDWKAFFRHILDSVDAEDLALSPTQYFAKAHWEVLDRLTASHVDILLDFESVTLLIKHEFDVEEVISMMVANFKRVIGDEGEAPVIKIRGAMCFHTPNILKVRLYMECPPLFAFHLATTWCASIDCAGKDLTSRLLNDGVIDDSFTHKGIRWTATVSVSSVFITPHSDVKELAMTTENMLRAVDHAINSEEAPKAAFRGLRAKLERYILAAPDSFRQYMTDLGADLNIIVDGLVSSAPMSECYLPVFRRTLIDLAAHVESLRGVLVYRNLIILQNHGSLLNPLGMFHEVSEEPQPVQAEHIRHYRLEAKAEIQEQAKAMVLLAQKFALPAALEMAERIGRHMDAHNLMLRQETEPRQHWELLSAARFDRLGFLLSRNGDDNDIDLNSPVESRSRRACSLIDIDGMPWAATHGALIKYEIHAINAHNHANELLARIRHTDGPFDDAAWDALNNLTESILWAWECIEIGTHYLEQARLQPTAAAGPIKFAAFLPTTRMLEERLGGAQHRMFKAPYVHPRHPVRRTDDLECHETMSALGSPESPESPTYSPRDPVSKTDDPECEDTRDPVSRTDDPECEDTMSAPESPTYIPGPPRYTPLDRFAPQTQDPAVVGAESAEEEPAEEESQAMTCGDGAEPAEEESQAMTCGDGSPELPASPVYDGPPPLRGMTDEEKAEALQRPVLFVTSQKNDGVTYSFLFSGGRHYYYDEDSTLPRPSAVNGMDRLLHPIPSFTDDEVRAFAATVAADPTQAHFMWLEGKRVGMVFQQEDFQRRPRIWAKLFAGQDLEITYTDAGVAIKAQIRPRTVPFLDIEFCVDDAKTPFDLSRLDTVIGREVNRYVTLHNQTDDAQRISARSKKRVELGPLALSEGYMALLAFDMQRLRRQNAPWKVVVWNVSEEKRAMYTDAAQTMERMQAQLVSLGEEEEFWPMHRRDPKRRGGKARAPYGSTVNSALVYASSDNEVDEEDCDSGSGDEFVPRGGAPHKRARRSYGGKGPRATLASKRART